MTYRTGMGTRGNLKDTKQVVGIVMEKTELEKLRERAKLEGRSVSNMGMQIIRGRAKPIC
jgi:hypothetical protein